MVGLEITFQILILIFSVVIHEVAHGYAAYAQGDNTAAYQGRLTLNPIVHLDFFGSFLFPLLTYFLGGFILGWAKPVPYNPYNLRNRKWGEALVAAAGPASNIFIALVFGMVVRFGGDFFNPSFIVISQFIVFINLLLAVFNLVPVPPLDGSKILFSILPYRFNNIRAFLERNALIFALIFIFFLWRFIVPVVSLLFYLIIGDLPFGL